MVAEKVFSVPAPQPHSRTPIQIPRTLIQPFACPFLLVICCVSKLFFSGTLELQSKRRFPELQFLRAKCLDGGYHVFTEQRFIRDGKTRPSSPSANPTAPDSLRAAPCR